MIICNTRVIDIMKPLFHNSEIDKGVGNLSSESFAILISGSFMIKLYFFIYCKFSLKF